MSQVNVKLGQVNVKSSQVNVKSSQVNLKSSQVNVKSSQVNVKSSQVNVKSSQVQLSLVKQSETSKCEVKCEVYYSKTMFLGLSQVYYWWFKCNTHNNYNYIIKTK